MDQEEKDDLQGTNTTLSSTIERYIRTIISLR